MDYNKKLESLGKEFEATMNHAVEVMNEIVATTIEQELLRAIDNLSDKDKVLLMILVELEDLTNQKEQTTNDEVENAFLRELERVRKQMEEEQMLQKRIKEDVLKYIFG